MNQVISKSPQPAMLGWCSSHWLTLKSIALSFLILSLTSSQAWAQVRVLVLGDNGLHRPSEMYRSIKAPLKAVGVELTYEDNVDAALNLDTLKKYDALLVYANIDSVTPDQEQALLTYVEEGGGYVPVHSASFCFQNSPKLIALTGAQFREHGGERFYTDIVEPDHELMKGFRGFESWDETYVHHKHNTEGRTVLEVRRRGLLARGTDYEPWTWVRTQGKGRVFYTAWGHNMDTWSHPGFINLLERGIKWAAKKPLDSVKPYSDPSLFPVPQMTKIADDLPPFTYQDVGDQIPHYKPADRNSADRRNLMQNPLLAKDSIQHYSVPVEFSIQLWASESDAIAGAAQSKFAGLQGKPMAMNWDHRGRLWLCETIDYPNELQPVGQGRDRIRICEDTDNDGVADKFTVFASGLSIPTAIVSYRDGVIVQDGTSTVYLKDTDGDDVADFRQVLITGWAMGDTHGGVSNFQYGVDNWIWGMQGYNNSKPVINGQPQQGFRQGFWRFAVESGSSDDTAPAYELIDGVNTKKRTQAFDDHTIRVSKLEFIRSTDNNTWGIGFSEEGLVFGSTANGNPSGFMPIANRYYERVLGWSPQVLKTIADSFKFKAITDKVRQVDYFGGYTAAAGHALYTARRYPQSWWNRIAFVCEPTGHLVGAFVLSRDGAGYKSTNPFNLTASVDEWAAPTKAEVGPDGNVWVIDWYNYIVQHNPTPQGFKNGKGNAYESELRDKKHGRIYRVVYEGTDGLDQATLEAGDALVKNGLNRDDEKQLVAALQHTNFFWRRASQRLLIEKKNLSESTLQALNDLIKDQSVDSVGIAPGAIHALWVLKGIGQPIPIEVGMKHTSAGVRLNTIRTAAEDLETVLAISQNGLLEDNDPQVRLAALLKLSDIGLQNISEDKLVAAKLTIQQQQDLANVWQKLANPTAVASLPNSQSPDRWLLDAWTTAASMHAKEVLPLLVQQSAKQATPALERISIVAEHAARSRLSAEACYLLGASPNQMEVSTAVINGLAKGWPKDHTPLANEVEISRQIGQKIVSVWLQSDVTVDVKSQIIVLANLAGVRGMEEALAKITKELSDVALDENKPVEQRVAAAEQATALGPDDAKLVDMLLSQLTAQSSPDLYDGFLKAFANSRIEGLGKRLIERSKQLTPEFGKNAIRLLMSRPNSTVELLDLIDEGSLTWNDFELDQKQALRDHPSESIRQRATELLKSKGLAMNADRQKVVENWMETTHGEGDFANGKAMYIKHCALCHVHGDIGVQIGPNLTGMSVHPKDELLVHILDPGRSVEGNFRTYSVRTIDDTIVTGMLAGETKTSLEIINAQGKREVVLREEIDELIVSQKSLMPEGFENQMTKAEMRDLLEFLTSKGKFVPLALENVATVITTKGMFYDAGSNMERLVFPDWGIKTFKDVPFALVDPLRDQKPNAIMLNGPNGPFAPRMPKQVEIPCQTTAVAIHMLSGVGGWNYPASPEGSVTMTVRLTYENGTQEDHALINGQHFADYIRRVDVPKSEFAFAMRGGQQIRYIKVVPKSRDMLKKIELIKGEKDVSAPIVMGITLQTTE